ncbi:MAG: hypothetical protein AAAB14_16345, partial [Ensifer adhaerens]
MARSLNIVYGNYGLNFNESVKRAFERTWFAGNIRPGRLFYGFPELSHACESNDRSATKSACGEARGAADARPNNDQNPASPSAKRGYFRVIAQSQSHRSAQADQSRDDGNP